MSVITPVYNGARFLEETLVSLVTSSYTNIEFIVLDDGSQDNSAEIAEKVLSESGRSYRVIRKPNSGEADTDNYGLSLSNGQYIAIVNCDDPVYPELISRSIAALQADEGAVVSYPDWHMIDENGLILRTNIVREYSLDSLLGDVQCLPGPGALIRRSAIKTPILRDPSFRFSSDYRQWLTLSTVGHFVRIPEVLCTWRIHAAQQTAQSTGTIQAQEMIRCVEDFYQNELVSTKAASLKNQALSMAHYFAALQSLHRKGVPGRRLLLRSYSFAFRRASGYEPERRSLILSGLVLFNPLGRILSQWAITKRISQERKKAKSV